MKQSDVLEQPMSLEDARKVRWNRQNPRPMGELLDEGIISRTDLKWAAERAFNPLQRQAAQVLLDALDRAPLQRSREPKPASLPPELANSIYAVGLTMDQIRAIEWPIPPYQGQPMGALFDKQQLTLKDLGYAAENAWEQRVRQAAVALMLVRLNQVLMEPPSPAGLLHVVSAGRSFSERRQTLYVFIEASLIGALEGALFIMFIDQIRAISTTPSKPLSAALASPASIIGLIIFLGLMIGLFKLGAVVLDFLLNRIDKQILYYRRGHEGEERVVAAMHSVLDGNWFLFRNIVLPGRNKSDLDSILVGPSGVWVVEIKNFTGEYRNTGEGWEYRARNRWKAAKNNPSRQAQDNAVRLASFLKADGIQQWVTPAVVWANPEAQLQVENPLVAVWTLDRLPDELDNIWQEKSLPESKRQQIVDKLTKLCEAQKKEALK